MILPLIQIMKSIDLITSDEINMIINNASFKIKELKYFKFSEFVTISEKIDEYLSEFTDELINFFPKNVDIRGISFLLYEILINVYKHSKFKNAYIQIINSEK